MVYAHVSDSLVAKAEWAGAFAQLYKPTRGLTAPLFLMVSGWAFAVATLGSIAEYRRGSKKLLGRVHRVLTLLMWGWLTTVPWWHPNFPFGAPEDAWLAFAALTPLHCVGLALAVALALVFFTRNTRTLAFLLLGLGAAVALVSPLVFAATSGWDWWWRGLFNAKGYLAGFPLFPWASFFLVGAGLGFYTREGQWTPKRLAVLFGTISVVSLSIALPLEGYFLKWMGDAYQYVGPALVLRRLGGASGLLALAALVTMRVQQLPKPLLVPSRYALTFYVGHLAMIWGSPFWLGLHHTVGPKLTFFGAFLLSGVILVGLWFAVTTAKRANDEWVPAAWRWAKGLARRVPVSAPEGVPVPVALAPEGSVLSDVTDASAS